MNITRWLNKKMLMGTVIPGVVVCCSLNACREKPEYYTFSDFGKIKKTDVHLHINSPDRCYMELAVRNNFRIISPNVDAGLSIDYQLKNSSSIRLAYPGRFEFFGTFSVDSFGANSFAEKTIDRINKCMKAGACGIKIWKNIGMTLKDKDGQYVMVDNPAFDPVFRYLEKNNIPVLGHLGEPKNCWLPLDEMTDTSNYRYYRAHPQYHMYLHPEAPSYEDQINARDNLLMKYPGLDFTGAHLASLEWSVDEIAKRLDRLPNLKVECSARMAHLQSQSVADREHVRNFMLKYQNRILYGTDITVDVNESNPDEKSHIILERWKSDWIYLATDSMIKIKNIPTKVKGLKLPAEVIDKIYNKNADRFFESM